MRIGVDEGWEGGGWWTSELMGTDQEREERENVRVGFPRVWRSQSFETRSGSGGGSPGGQGSREKHE